LDDEKRLFRTNHPEAYGLHPSLAKEGSFGRFAPFKT
jgi:hypothetical protein